MSYNDFEAVIGLEVHVQLKTTTKIFCSDATSFDASDNENTSPISIGMPGTLPLVNRKAIEYAVKTGLALGCQIRNKSIFARKNYFYPDLPKGYQISQYDLPLCEKGEVKFVVQGKEKRISIERAHVEEDAGKSTHHGDYTLLNYNRAGIPLLEIVSGPDLRSAQEAAEYARVIRQIVRYLDVCDGNLEEGSLRCDCNVSVRLKGEDRLGTKVEIKNINSFRFIEKAIEYEIERQVDAIESGAKIIQETRLWDPDKNRTFSMRTKEDAQDYRYFPDPDLLPLSFSQEMIERMRAELPELPRARAERFVSQLGLSDYDASVMTQERAAADYFEAVGKECGNYKAAANWIMTDLTSELNREKLEIKDSPISSVDLGALIRLIDEGKISGKMAKVLFAELWSGKKDPRKLMVTMGLTQISDEASLLKLIAGVLAESPQQVQEYRSGKTKLFGYFVGALMKASKGQAHPEIANRLLKDALDGK